VVTDIEIAGTGGKEMTATRMTITEFFGLIGRAAVDGRELASADSTEYLALVTHIVSRDASKIRQTK
jgi:hypothetical protein